jgi:T5SS/PEP-CTERM-associated repeat protein
MPFCFAASEKHFTSPLLPLSLCFWGRAFPGETMTIRAKLFGSTMLCGLALSPTALADQILDANGSFVVSTPGVTPGQIIVGNNTGPATFTVTENGSVESTSTIFGFAAAADGNSAVIEGEWTNIGVITVGNNGSDNTLTIQNGGEVESQSTWIGGEASSTGNQVIVDGIGSRLDNSTDVTVGYGSTGNSLTIRNGATSTNSLLYMGWSAAADDNTLTVTGLGSTLTIDDTGTDTGVLYLGHDGSGNTLNLLDQATMTVDKDMLLGANTGSDGNTLNISDAGSKLDIGGRLYVGRSGSNNSVIVENGGEIVSASGRIGGSSGSTAAVSGNTVTIKGSGSKWTLNGSLRIGDGVGGAATSNVLSVEDGGTVLVTSGSTTIGTLAGDNGNQLRVKGVGSTYTTVSSIIVGAAGSNSLLEIDDNGAVSAGAVSVGITSTLRMGSGATLGATGLTLADGSLTQVAIDFEDPVSIQISGTATLDGDLEATVGPKGILGNRYDILTAGTRSGTFDTIDVTGLSSNIDYTFDYTNTQLSLYFTSNIGDGGDFNDNQQNVADALDDYFNAGGIFAPGFGILAGLTGDELADALSEVSGEVGATGGARAVQQATNAFLGLMLQGKGPGRTEADMMSARVGDASIMPTADVIAAPEPGWTMWGGVYGGSASLPGDSGTGSHDTDTDMLGIATGWDYAFSDETTLGFAIAGGGTRWDLDESMGSGDSTFLQVGAHGTQRFGASYLSLAGAYAWHWMETERTVTVDGSETLDADFDAGNLAGRIEGGHRFGADGDLGLTPYAALQAQAVYMPDYEESGGDFAVAYDEETATAVRSELGLRLDMTADAVRLHAGLAWAHDWQSDGNVNASFQSLPGSSFIVNGADSPDDIALVSAGAEFGLGSQTSLSAQFDGEFGEDYTNYGGTLALSYNW